MAGKNVEKGRILRNESARPIHFPNDDRKFEDLNSAPHMVLEDIRNDEFQVEPNQLNEMTSNNLKMMSTQLKRLQRNQLGFLQNLSQELLALFDSDKVEDEAKFKFFSELLFSGLLVDGSNDAEMLNEYMKEAMKLAIKIACTKSDDGSRDALIKSVEKSQSPEVIAHLQKWLQDNFGLNPEDDSTETMGDFPMAGGEENAEEIGAPFLYKAPPKNRMEKVATLTCETNNSDEKHGYVQQLDRTELIASFPNTTVKSWNLLNNQERIVELHELVENWTVFTWEEDKIISGTSNGSRHLFDSKTLEEKWQVRLGEHVEQIRYDGPTVLVQTRGVKGDKLWRLDVCLQDMKFLNRKRLAGLEEIVMTDFCMDSLYIFVHNQDAVFIYSTETLEKILDDGNCPCWLKPPAELNVLHVADLHSTKRVVVGGCEGGLIALWTTDKLARDQRPFKVFQAHQETVVSCCTLDGHLVSLDERGQLLMWSAFDLENPNVDEPFPRVLSPNLGSASKVYGFERWLVTNCEDENAINVWALPDLWIRAG